MTGRVGGSGSAPRDKNPPAHRPSAMPPDPEPPATPQTPPPTPAGVGPLRRVVRIVNPNGLHPRVADRFSRTAKQYSCTVIVWNGELRADGKDIWELIGLMAMPDSDVILEVDGPDAAKAVELLAEVLASPSGEDYTI